MHIIDRYRINELVIAGTGQENHRLPWTGEDSYGALVRKYYPNVKNLKLEQIIMMVMLTVHFIILDLKQQQQSLLMVVVVYLI